MPSPPKERPSGRLGRLLAALRPSRAGPLPVQTGFPTSLADLVVKNHGRLKKPSPSSKRRKNAQSPSPSPSASPSPSLPSSSPPPPPPAAAVSQSDRPCPDLRPAQADRRSKGGAFGLGLGFLSVSGVVFLALLVIWSKKVVAAVTVATFSLFLLESLRSFRRPRPAATTRQLFLDGRGRVSPIREVETDAEPSRPSCSDSDRGTELSILAVEERSGALDETRNPRTKKTKRSWKKLIASAKKLHIGRKSADADSPGSFRSECNESDVTVGGNAKATDAVEDAIAREPSSLGSSRRSKVSEVDARLTEIDALADLADVEEDVDRRVFRFPALVMVAVVLVGLVAGKLPAVAFTMLCFAFLGWIQRLSSGVGGLRL